MSNKAPLRSPIKQVRGLGSAKSGTHHFLIERLSALALIPLGVWFVITLLGTLLDGEVSTLVLWLDSPINAALMAFFILFSFVHSKAGVQVIIEDYVHGCCSKPVLSLINTALHFLFGLLSLMAIFKLHFMPSLVS